MNRGLKTENNPIALDDDRHWAQQRSEFPQLENQIYFNSCSVGALSKRVIEATERYLNGWYRFGGRSWYAAGGWLQTIQDAREKIALLLGAGPHEIALAPNASTGLAAIASAIEFGARKQVVVTKLDFPTLAYQWLSKASLGVQTCVIGNPGANDVNLEMFERAVDMNVALVATSRVFFTNGHIQEIGSIAQLAHDRGALLLVDDYQATGQIPIDVKELGIDILVGGTSKWLLGGPGLAFVYIRDELHSSLNPTCVGWFGHRRQLEFVVDTFEPRTDALKFELGTPAIAPLYAANASLDIIRQIGPDRIRSRMQYLVADLLERLTAAGLSPLVHHDPNRQSAIVKLPCDEPASVGLELLKQNILVDSRPGCIRVAPYFYNTTDENAEFCKQLSRIIVGNGGSKLAGANSVAARR